MFDLVHDLVYLLSMKIVNVHEAKTHLSRLLRRVAAGEEIVIAKAGRPFARLLPMSAEHTSPRTLGQHAGRFHVPADFNTSLPPDVLDSFEGRE